MKKLRIMIPALLGFIFSVAAAEPGRPEFQPAAGPEIDSVIASVNGEAISLSDVLPESRSQEYQLYAVYSGDQLYEAVLKERKRILEEIIDRKLLLAEYRQEPFVIPPQYLENYLDSIAESYGIRSRSQFADMLRASGTSLEEIRRQAEERLIVQAMTSRKTQVGVNITPRAVFEYYREHREEFAAPEKWQLSLILLAKNNPEREVTAARIAGIVAGSPDRFGELARKYSSGVNAERGGDLGLVEKKRLRPEFAAVLGEAPEVGKVYGPVAGAEGDYFLRVTELIPAAEPEYRQLESEIRARLEEETRTRVMREYLDELRGKAIIRYYI